jgi:hypothetical protein
MRVHVWMKEYYEFNHSFSGECVCGVLNTCGLCGSWLGRRYGPAHSNAQGQHRYASKAGKGWRDLLDHNPVDNDLPNNANKDRIDGGKYIVKLIKGKPGGRKRMKGQESGSMIKGNLI